MLLNNGDVGGLLVVAAAWALMVMMISSGGNCDWCQAPKIYEFDSMTFADTAVLCSGVVLVRMLFSWFKLSLCFGSDVRCCCSSVASLLCWYVCVVPINKWWSLWCNDGSTETIRKSWGDRLFGLVLVQWRRSFGKALPLMAKLLWQVMTTNNMAIMTMTKHWCQSFATWRQGFATMMAKQVTTTMAKFCHYTTMAKLCYKASILLMMAMMPMRFCLSDA